VRHAEIIVCLRVIRLEAHGLLIGRHGVRVLLKAIVGIAHVVKGLGEARAYANGLPERIDGPPVAFQIIQSEPKIVVGIRILWVKARGLL
jgi:hypothetical protein